MSTQTHKKTQTQKILLNLIIRFNVFFVFLFGCLFSLILSPNSNNNFKVQAASKQNIILELLTQEYTYDGSPKSYIIKDTLLKDFVIEYGAYGEYSTTAPTNAGTYNVRITRAEDNYYYQYNKVVYGGLVINQATYDIDDLTASDATYVYDGKAHYPTLSKELPVGADGIELDVNYSQDVSEVNSGKSLVKITITSTSDNYVNPNLKLQAYVEITPFQVAITWCEDNFTYNGENQKSKLWATYVDAFGVTQNLKITCNESEFKNYQENGYDMIASFYDKEYNHSLPKVYTKTYHINKIAYDMSGISFKPQIFTFNGKSHSIEIDGTLPTGFDNEQVKVSYEYTGNRIDASSDKVLVTANFTGSSNYENIASMDSYFIINPLLVDVYWSDDNFTFNNTDQSSQVKAWWFDINNIKHYFVTDLTNFINYQENGYIVSVAFDSNNFSNYAVSPLNTKTYHIKKSTYSMKSVSFTDESFVYDGKAHSLEISGVLPIGLDGSTVSVTYEGAATNVSEGKVKVKAIFTSESANYENPNSLEAWVSITSKAVDVYWCDNDFVYNGQNQKEAITAWWFDINNEKHYAGVYMDDFIDCSKSIYFAQAYLGDSDIEKNYYLQRNTSSSFNMKQASYDMSGITFENEEVTYDGKSHHIEVKGTLPTGADGIQLQATYQGEACNVIDGKTLIRVTFSTDSVNYLTPKEQVAYLTITPKTVTPIFVEQDLVYDGTNQINKFDTYYYDVNNNKVALMVRVQSDTPLTLRDAGTYTLETAFMNSDSNYVLGEDSTHVCVIQKIDYDLSNISLSDKTFIYDGKVHNLTIDGTLPTGLEVTYSEGLTQPGKKTITATFINHSNNYNTPEPISACISILATSLNSNDYFIKLSSSNGFQYGYTINVVVKESLTKVQSGLLKRFEKINTVYELQVLDPNGKQATLADLTSDSELTVEMVLPSTILYSNYKIAVKGQDGNYQILTKSKIPTTTSYHELQGYFETNISELTTFVFITEENCHMQVFWILLLVVFIAGVIVYYFVLNKKKIDVISIIGFSVDACLIILLAIFSHCTFCWVMFGINIFILAIGVLLFLFGKRIRFYVENY